MKLNKILPLVSESSRVDLWSDGETLDSYETKTDIPKNLLSREVLSISGGYYKIDIEIKEGANV